MEDWLSYIVQNTSVMGVAYIGVVAILLLGGFVFPIPEDVPLLIGGALCAYGHATLWLMLPTAFFAVLVADLIMFHLGRRFGHHVPRLPLIGRFIKQKHLRRAEKLFIDHGGKTLFIARFLPGLRAAVFLVGGAAKVPYWKILWFDGMAALFSVPTFVLVGYWGAHQLELVRKWAADAQFFLWGFLLVLLVGVIIWKCLRRRKVASAT